MTCVSTDMSIDVSIYSLLYGFSKRMRSSASPSSPPFQKKNERSADWWSSGGSETMRQAGEKEKERYASIWIIINSAGLPSTALDLCAWEPGRLEPTESLQLLSASRTP